MENKNSTLIILQPKNAHSYEQDRTFRFDGKSQDYLDGFKDALEEVMENFLVFKEKV